MHSPKMSAWIESQVEKQGRTAMRVRVGADIRKLDTIGIVVLREALEEWENTASRDDLDFTVVDHPTDMSEAVEALAVDAGWPHEYPTLRVFAARVIDGKRRFGPNKLAPKVELPPDVSVSGGSDPMVAIVESQAAMLDKLLTANVRMMNGVTTQVEVLSTSLAAREEHASEMFGKLVQAKMDAVDDRAQADAEFLELTLQQALDQLEDLREASDGEPWKERAVGLLEQALTGKLAGMGRPSVDDLIHNEDLVDEVLDHPDAEEVLGEALKRKMARDEASQSAGSPPTGPAPEQPDAPAP